MSNLDTINVGGINYDIEDATARPNAASALTITAYKEDGNTASRSYSVVGTPINWKGTLYYTSATIAAGATLAVGTNLVAATNIGQYLLTRTNRIRTYVGSDSKLHFTDATGADSVLPFSSSDFVAAYGGAYSPSNGYSRQAGIYKDGYGIAGGDLSDNYITLQIGNFGSYGDLKITPKRNMVVSYAMNYSNGLQSTASHIELSANVTRQVQGQGYSLIIHELK